MSAIPPDISRSLRSIGRDKFRGTCPIADHRSALTFSVARHPDGHQVWQCFACNLRGSVIDLVAAMEGVTIRDAIRKLSEKDCVAISKDAILQRAYDQIQRSYPAFGYLACNTKGCFTVRSIETELEFEILRSGSSWLWKVSPSGRVADCGLHQFTHPDTRKEITKILLPFIEQLPVAQQLREEIAKGD